MTALGGSVEEAKEACERYVAVTAAHVLLFRIDLLDGQSWWIVLVARPTDVTMEERSFVKAGFLGGLALTVSSWQRGVGDPRISGRVRPKPVLDAWRTGSTQRLSR